MSLSPEQVETILDQAASNKQDNKGGLCRIKHGVVGPVAGTVLITQLQQNTRRSHSLYGFGHQRSGCFGLHHTRTPSRAMLASKAGFTYVSGCSHSSNQTGRGEMLMPVSSKMS